MFLRAHCDLHVMTAETKPEWVKLKPAEIESIMKELHKQGMAPAQIGLVLRDKHGIPKVRPFTGKKISRMMKDNKLDIPPQSARVHKEIERVEKHLERNKHDYSAKRSLNKRQWTLHRLALQEQR